MVSVFRHGRARPGHPRGTPPLMPEFSIRRCFRILFGELGVLVDGRVNPGSSPGTAMTGKNERLTYDQRCQRLTL